MNGSIFDAMNLGGRRTILRDGDGGGGGFGGDGPNDFSLSGIAGGADGFTGETANKRRPVFLTYRTLAIVSLAACMGWLLYKVTSA
jgi:hypothetical protein